MLSPEHVAILESVVERCPRYIKYLEQKLQQELNDLPSVSPDKVQIFQGRAKFMQELLAEFEGLGSKANRNAKP